MNINVRSCPKATVSIDNIKKTRIASHLIKKTRPIKLSPTS